MREKIDKAAQVRALRETRAARNTPEARGKARKATTSKAVAAPAVMTKPKRTKGRASPNPRAKARETAAPAKPQPGGHGVKPRASRVRAGRTAKEAGEPRGAVPVSAPKKRAPKGTFDRKGYMKDYMRKKRAEK